MVSPFLKMTPVKCHLQKNVNPMETLLPEDLDQEKFQYWCTNRGLSTKAWLSLCAATLHCATETKKKRTLSSLPVLQMLA